MTDTAADWPPKGVELTDEKRARLAAFARECIVHSGGDPEGGESEPSAWHRKCSTSARKIGENNC